MKLSKIMRLYKFVRYESDNIMDMIIINEGQKE